MLLEHWGIHRTINKELRKLTCNSVWAVTINTNPVLIYMYSI